MNYAPLLFAFAGLLATACDSPATKQNNRKAFAKRELQTTQLPRNKPTVRTVHVFVALCDNRYQGILPVPKAIGNGQDPENNLYWGCDNGVRTYFKKKSSNWVLLQRWKAVSPQVLERLLFRHKTANVFLLADAYDGRFIAQTTKDFLDASSGRNRVAVAGQNDSLYFGGASALLAYIGHDGLMDFSLPLQPVAVDTAARQTIILACYSKACFWPHLVRTRAQPLLWTTNLMAPEAYTLHDALQAWVEKKPAAEIQNAAAAAYARFQHCPVKAARNLLVTGW